MRISEMDFNDQDVDLDFHEFDHCKFTNCRLIIHGHGPVNLSVCHFDGCSVVAADAAMQTLVLLSMMYQGGFTNAVDGFIDSVRTGRFPRIEPKK
jgi:hypothetical protein